MGSDRAKLFMPFNSLRGYYDMILETKREKMPRRELSEDAAAALSDKLNRLRKGDVITVTYYNVDSYDKLTGIVSEVDKVFRRLMIVRTRILFDDLADIEFIEETPLSD